MSLKVDNISVQVNERKILSGVSFSAKPGEIVAVLGPNGAGKSTLIKVIAGTLQPNNGVVYWKQKKLAEWSKNMLARERAVLTQQLHMGFEFPVSEVVMMGRYPYFNGHPSTEDVLQVKSSMRQTETEKFYNRSYQTLSGGEQQRVQLARVTAQVAGEDNHKLLLLDEPLNNLDIRHQHHTLNQAQTFASKENTVMAVIHDVNIAALYAHKILLLKNGMQLAFGTPDEVLTEELLSECYEFPARVEKHPYHHCPVVYFGCPVKKETNQPKEYDAQISN